jgi:hypothetical protein
MMIFGARLAATDPYCKCRAVTITRALAGIGIVVAISSAIFAGPTAFAAGPTPYPPSVCAQISVSSTIVGVGQPFQVSGKGFPANRDLTVKANPGDVVLARVDSDRSGNFTTSVSFPRAWRGSRIISVTGGGLTCPPDPITIMVAPGGHKTPPASTGVDVELGLIVAAILLGLGGLFVISGQRRDRYFA